MSEQRVQKKSKGLIIGLIIALFFVGAGGVSAFFLFNKSPKTEYLLAEANSAKQMSEVFKGRYQNELKWVETQEKKPVESNIDLSAEWTDSNVDIYMQEIQSLVNNSNITIKNVYDPVKKEIEVGVGGALGSTKIDLGKLFITEEKLLADLPFAKDLIQFKDQDFGKLMKELDDSYEGQDELGLAKLFDRSVMSGEELHTYLTEEYMTHFIEELSSDSFTSDNEEIEVFDQKIKAEKLTMTLSEEEIKNLMKELIEKVRTDEKIKELLKDAASEQLAYTTFPQDEFAIGMDELMEDFDETLLAMSEDVDTWELPEGLTSTIWTNKAQIVKRHFELSLDEDVTLKVVGTQLMQKEQQQWAYDVTLHNEYFEEDNTLVFTGDLNWDGKEGNDRIGIQYEDAEVFYTGEEKLVDKTRTFTRSLGALVGYEEAKLVWDGSATHEKDSLQAAHEFTADIEGSGLDVYRLHVKQDSKIVKKVEMPDASEKVIDLGELGADGIERFIEEDLMGQIEEWAYRLMGDVESELYNY